MKIVNKNEMNKLIGDYGQDGGIIFAEYVPHILTSDVMVTDGHFGATNIIPKNGEVFDWDWNIDEYKEKDLFVVFDNNDVLQIIQTLTRGLKIELKNLE